MCVPAVMLAVAGISAFTQYQQAQQQAKAAEANAAIMRQNADIQNKAAVDAENRGANEASVMRQNALKANATARANAAGAGLIADKGTFGDIQDQNTGTGEFNALTAQNNAEREAYGFRVNAMNDMNSANMASFEAKSARYNGLLTAGTTLVSGAAKAYGSWSSSPDMSQRYSYGSDGTKITWNTDRSGRAY